LSENERNIDDIDIKEWEEMVKKAIEKEIGELISHCIGPISLQICKKKYQDKTGKSENKYNPDELIIVFNDFIQYAIEHLKLNKDDLKDVHKRM